jgi:DNA adenine methylase
MSSIPESAAKPFAKWAGGKQALASTLTSYFPSEYERYSEPFLGGGSVFLSLSPSRSILGDANEWLIDTYEAIRDDWESVAEILDSLVNTRDAYLRYRSVPITELDFVRRAAHFIYLNKTCFRGLFRVNRNGQFNVPYGDYDRRYYDAANLQAVSSMLQKAELRRGDFELVLFDVNVKDFVYLDPPYVKLGGHSDFNRYTSTQFRLEDHVRLAAFCNEMTNRGVRWAQSNSDTQLVRELYAEYEIVQLNARREINLDSQKRNITELLIRNY